MHLFTYLVPVADLVPVAYLVHVVPVTGNNKFVKTCIPLCIVYHVFFCMHFTDMIILIRS